MSERDIFTAARAMTDSSVRSAYLERACAGDSALRDQVEALLRAHGQPDSLLDAPLVAPPDADHAATRAFSPDADHADTRTGSGTSGTDDEVPLGFLAPATRPDSLGRIGHYEVLQVLGQGGFGIVFRAFDEVLQRVVAVKVLAPQLAATSPARKRFLREARTSAAVRHENVVQVYEVGEAPLPHIAMEFIPGETLQQRLDRIGPVEPVEVVRIGRQIAEGLAAAHASDLIHRDIKPGNILLEGSQQRVKITDFGLARAADDASISQSGIIAGTPMYMAPEQALGHKLDQRADLFSLGSVLYQMAAGRPPFRASGTVAVLKRVAEDTPRDIREITPETPQWLCNIIAKLHEKKPEDRFQTAREVADVLADCEAQLKENAKLKDFSRIPKATQAARPLSGRRKWVAAAAVLLPLFALAVTESAGLTRFITHPPSEVVNSKPTVGDAERTLPEGLYALAYDGKKSLVKIPSLKLGDHAFTVDTWATLERPVDDASHYNLLTNSGFSGFSLGVPPNANAGQPAFAFTVRVTNPERYVLAFEKQPVPRKQLVHLAGVYDGQGEIRFYANGQLQNRTSARHFKPSDRSLTLGGHPDFGGQFFGRMNEVRVSKVARYEADFTPTQRWKPDADTIAIYSFDEGQGSVLKDSSGNGHHGEIIAAKWVKADGSAIGSPPTAPSEPLPPTFTNSLGMEFVKVPKGKSWLGGGKDMIGDREVEIPADFYLGKYEVTQEEWARVIGENPSHFSRTGDGKDAVKDIPEADLKRFPVENVSWESCQLFVAKLNQREKETGWVYRLPTEAEWQYACRGGPMAGRADSAFDYYFAEPTNTLTPAQANFGPDGGLNRTCKVGSYTSNRLGLFDMHGNVFEWCDDTFKDPRFSELQRVHIGGSWHAESAIWCRAGGFVAGPPSQTSNFLGLRLARIPVGVPSSEAKTPPTAVAPFTDADVKRITALPAEQQVEEVRKELVRRNPGFDGKFETKIKDGVVTEFRIVTDRVVDISPIRVFNALQVLDLSGTWTGRPNGLLADLTAIKGMSLGGLKLLNLAHNTNIADADLMHFKDCTRLAILHLNANQQVTDAGLASFKDCKALTLLHLAGTNVGDAGLTHFKDCKELTSLHVPWTNVSNVGLAHLKGLPLKELWVDHTAITDLTPLQGMPLEGVLLTPKTITHGLDILREMKSLKTIGVEWNQAWPAAEFWERYDKGEFDKAAAPFTDADVKRIAALPAEQQVEEVRKELVRRNPGFDGTVGHKIENGVVTELRIVTDQVTDISPIRVFNALKILQCSGTLTNGKANGQLANLAPLQGMSLNALTELSLDCTKVADEEMVYFKDCKGLRLLNLSWTDVTDKGLAHFKDCKNLTELWLINPRISDAGLAHFKDCTNLTYLNVGEARVSDDGLNHLKNCKALTRLYLQGTEVSNTGLMHLKGLPLKAVWIDHTSITDLTPLQGLPLEEIHLTPKNITKGLDLLRDMKSLKTIGIQWDQSWSAAEFWERYDKGEFKQ